MFMRCQPVLFGTRTSASTARSAAPSLRDPEERVRDALEALPFGCMWSPEDAATARRMEALAQQTLEERSLAGLPVAHQDYGWELRRGPHERGPKRGFPPKVCDLGVRERRAPATELG